MNTEALFLFLILLLGLVLCSFLGSNYSIEDFTGSRINELRNRRNTNNGTSTTGAATGYPIDGDNYNHVSGTMTSLQNGSTLYGPNGGKMIVVQNSDGSQNLEVTLPNGKIMTLYPKQQEKNDTFESTSTTTVESYTNYYGVNGSATIFYGPDGVTATVVKGDQGHIVVHLRTNEGNYIFTPNSNYYNPENTENNSSTQYYGSTGYTVNTYQGAYGGQAAVATGPDGNTVYYAEGPRGNAVYGSTSSNTNPNYNATQYYGPYGGEVTTVTGPAGNTAYYAEGAYGNAVYGTTSSNTNPNYSATQYYGPYGGEATTVTGPAGNTAYYAEGPYGNAVAGTTDGSEYYDSLPPGIPASQIPPGQEDLYILKSQVVPPVCPVCPVCPAAENISEIIEKTKEVRCPPCKPCGRCPEPAFECKKVPNYNAINNNQLPIPVLNDFSTFGM
jgi:hypothetical protein